MPDSEYPLGRGERLEPANRIVLFVCVENSCRSLMAEAIFRRGGSRGWTATSAGATPAREVNPRTRAMLEEIGVALPDHPPQLLTESMAQEASHIITMGCLDQRACPSYLRIRVDEDWDLPDPAALDDEKFRALRGEIAGRVASLIARLRA